MAKGEDWDESEWFNLMYNSLTRDPVTADVGYDMADQTRGRAEYERAGGWGNPQVPPGAAQQRADYANRLKMQRKLAEELRNQGAAGHVNQIGELLQQQ